MLTRKDAKKTTTQQEDFFVLASLRLCRARLFIKKTIGVAPRTHRPLSPLRGSRAAGILNACCNHATPWGVTRFTGVFGVMFEPVTLTEHGI